MIKKIIGVVVGLILLAAAGLTILVFVTPTDFRVEREITIAKPKPEVLNYTKYLKNQNEWGPWVKKDPAIRQTFRGNDGEAGFISAWESENEEVGSGEQEIKSVTDSRIDTELRFKKPFESTSQAFMILEEVSPAQTRVKWGFTGTFPRPMNLMLVVMDIDKEVGKDFNEGLASLKDILEKRAQ